MVTWRKLIADEMALQEEDWSDVVSCTLSDKQLDREFTPGIDAPNGTPFTLWTKMRIYFPLCTEEEGVASVARNPDGEPTDHFGGH